jgi:hypothetical protein
MLHRHITPLGYSSVAIDVIPAEIVNERLRNETPL